MLWLALFSRFAVHSRRAVAVLFIIISQIQRNQSFTDRISRLCYFLWLCLKSNSIIFNKNHFKGIFHTIRHWINVSNLTEVGLSPSNFFICFDNSPLKMMKKWWKMLFILSFILILLKKLFSFSKFLSWLFRHVEKRLD